LKTLLKFVVSCLDILTASILYINIGTVLANSKESDKGKGDLVSILLRIELVAPILLFDIAFKSF